MSVFVGLFWSLFVFDMVGDRHPIGGVIAAVMMIITCPLVFISLQWILTYINADTNTDTNTDTNSNSNSNSNCNDYKHRMNDGIEKISQSVHGSIWRCIHSVLMMKEIVNSNNDDNGNTRVTETISPLSAVRIQ